MLRFLAPVVLSFVAFLRPLAADAAIILINSTTEAVDGNDGLCTLAEAIIAANANVASGPAQGECNAGAKAPDLDEILFDLAGPGPITFSLTTPLPPIVEPVLIDGLSVAGTDCSSLPPTLSIQLSGSPAAGDGVVLAAGSDGSVLRGLVLNGFTGSSKAAVLIQNSNANWVTCNFIGTNTTGTAAAPNSVGVSIDNGDHNEVGTNADGVNDSSEGNLISGNTVYGIWLQNGDSNRVSGNRFGTDVGGNLTIPATQSALLLGDGASSNLIGSDESGFDVQAEKNTITAGTEGVLLAASAGHGNAIRRNSIFGNLGIGIDLNVDGPTSNDPQDGDNGPNRLQNFPVISDAVLNVGKGEFAVRYFVRSAPVNTAYSLLVDFYLADGSGRQGEILLATDTFTSSDFEAAQPKLFEFAWVAPVTPGQAVVAVATDAMGNSSEFSHCLDAFGHGFEDADAATAQCSPLVQITP